MNIEVGGLKEGKRSEFSYTLCGVEELLSGRLFRLKAPVSVSGEYAVTRGAVDVRANLEVSAVFNCDRCLREVGRDFSLEIDETFYPKADAEDFSGACSDSYFHDGRSIELDGFLREKLCLALPEYVVCKDTCKGLCPSCGRDLNIQKCNCDKKDGEASSPFGTLAELASGGKNGSTKKKNV